MAETNSSPLQEGAHNLLINCAGLATDDRLAVICEDPSLGWYDSVVPEVVCETADNLGLNTTIVSVSGPTPDQILPENAAEALSTHDHTLFFARLGDQSRFSLLPTARMPVMSYTYTADLLASAYGQFNYQAFFDFKLAVDQSYDDSTQIRITCPLGTDITGTYTANATESDDVRIKRFPLGIHKPISIEGFSGHVALSRFLVSTGSRSYTPAFAAFEDIVLAKIEDKRIVKFDGPKASVDKISRHYAMVSSYLISSPCTSIPGMQVYIQGVRSLVIPKMIQTGGEIPFFKTHGSFIFIRVAPSLQEKLAGVLSIQPSKLTGRFSGQLVNLIPRPANG